MTLARDDQDMRRFKDCIKTKAGIATPIDGHPPGKRDCLGNLSHIPSTSPINVGSIQESKMCMKELPDDSVRQDSQIYVADVGYTTPISKIRLNSADFTGTLSRDPRLLDTMPRLACAFCHSSEESEISGSMLHYDHGKSVQGDQALKRNVVHVHQKCIDWAPEVYFEDGIARNLEKEVARAARLKCSKCKQKGAPLGCYVESCRKTYHAPCAVQLSDCRWDTENFWLLCPNHYLEAFPSDRSRTEKKVRIGAASMIPVGQKETDRAHRRRSSLSPSSPVIEVRDKMILRDKDHWTGPIDVSGKWVLCGSSLSIDDCILLTKFAQLTGASVSRDWDSSVTHVIAATDELGACSRTLEYLMAILNGKWILRVDWIKACLEAKCPVAEIKYEILNDVHGFFGGPMSGRMRVIEKAPQLFSGLNFYFTGHFDRSYKGHLEKLISAAGGTILKEIGMPIYGLKAMIPSTLIVYNLADQAQSIKAAEILATKTGFPVVAHIWILDSIAGCEIQSF